MKIGVLMGGISAEREVSLKTGDNMLASIDPNKYEVVPIILDTKYDVMDKCNGIEFALLALHGKYGEDGQIQSILDAMGIPYSGSDVKSSAIAMDKDLAKVVLRGRGITTADWITIKDDDNLSDLAIPFLQQKRKVVVKPNSGGSSVMTFICEDEKHLRDCIEKVLSVDSEVMVEEFISGEELTVPILEGRVLPTISIMPPDGFFDYTAKYQEEAQGGAKEEVVYFPEELQKKINEISLATYNALKCSVYGRVDLILRDGIPYVLEMNTLPGMTPTSLIPKSAKSIGMSYTQLVEEIIRASMRRWDKDQVRGI